MKPRSNWPTKVIWHHSNGTLLSSCAKTQHHTADIIDASHKTRWPGFTSQIYRNSRGELNHTGYHIVIDLNRKLITMTRGFYEEAAACVGMNRSAVQVLIIGNYDSCSGEVIQEKREYLIAEAWDMIKKEFPHLTIPDNVPHRTYSSKSCYGDSLSDQYIQQVIIRHQKSQSNAEATKEVVDLVPLKKQLIDLLRQYIALLLQNASGKRLSMREVRKTA